ncbi:MAG: hypothetical protein M5U26_08530 [Planctomycetota bacterium]|nr:hypothetical protein [Planctomycetota bacterium]
MPAFGVVNLQGRTRRQHSVGQLWAIGEGGAAFEHAHVSKIFERTGLVPGQAFIEIRGNGRRGQIPNVLLQENGTFAPNVLKYWSRAAVSIAGQPAFVGNLCPRSEASQPNCLTLEYRDDRVLLARLPIRGAWVWDAYADEAKFIPRYIARFNPFGYRNCIRAGKDLYLFADLAERGAGAGGVEAAEDEPAIGAVCAWTRERIVKYLRFAAHTVPDAYYTNYKKLDASKLLWPEGACSFGDLEMRKAAPDLTLAGKSMLLGLYLVLQGGGYGLAVRPEGPKSAKSVLFFPGRTPATAAAKIGLDLQVGGQATDFRTIFEFTLGGDATELATSVLLEGSTPKVETELSFTPYAGAPAPGEARLDDSIGSNSFVPAWSADEEEDFVRIIEGFLSATYATVAEDRNNIYGSRVEMDGMDGRPLILAHTSEAVRLAFQQHPNVLRHWRIVSDPGWGGFGTVETALAGVDDAFAAAPFLNTGRAPLPEQLQHYFESGGDERGLLRLPIRIQVDTNGTGTSFHEITANPGLRIRSDGIVELNLVEVIAGVPANDLVYAGTLLGDGNARLVTLRALKINLAFQHDTRVASNQELTDGGEDYNEIYDVIDESVMDGEGNIGLVEYIFAPENYREWHQVASKPGANTDWPKPSGEGTDAAPLTRVLHTESERLEAHAKGRLADVARIKGPSVSSLIGVQLGVRAGDFLTHINLRGAGEGGKHKVNRPVGSVEHDFNAQATKVYAGD